MAQYPTKRARLRDADERRFLGVVAARLEATLSAHPSSVIERPGYSMPKNRTLKVVAGIAASFAALVGAIIFLAVRQVISSEMAMLMIVALFAMYVGFGILIAVYRLIGKLE